MGMPRDRRYGTTKWRATSLLVRKRAGYQCWVPGCERRAEAADHVVPVHPGMSDFEFYSFGNLRASCRPHNTARGVAAQLERDVAGAPTPPRRAVIRSAYGRPRVR